MFDYLIVGAGISGAMLAHKIKSSGKTCLVMEKSNHIGGFCYTEDRYGITIHKHGAHIFRTNKKEVWDFVNSICNFVPFVNSPLANYKGKLYNLPFNMNTFHQLWGVNTPEEAIAKFNEDIEPRPSSGNLEDHVLCSVGKDIYRYFIKEYTEKQWGVPCAELPADIMKRIPVRFTYDNNYYNELYQGVPEKGYTHFITRLLEGIPVLLNADYLQYRKSFDFSQVAKKVIYTGAIDAYFDYRYGQLDYRSVRFVEKEYTTDLSVQGNAVINNTSADVPYTRSIEHKLLLPHTISSKSVISYEYPCDYHENGEPCYPLNTEKNNSLYLKYKALADKEQNTLFFGRLAQYRYYSMNDIVERVLNDDTIGKNNPQET